MKRSTPLKRSGRLRRTARLKAKGESQFPKRRDDADGKYANWIRGRDCTVCSLMHPHRGSCISNAYPVPEALRCQGRTEADHLRTRGAGGRDLGNLIPLCTKHHTWRHTIGIRSFAHELGDADLQDWARMLCGQYREAETVGS